jgi:hypothetical protein
VIQEPGMAKQGDIVGAGNESDLRRAATAILIGFAAYRRTRR